MSWSDFFVGVLSGAVLVGGIMHVYNEVMAGRRAIARSAELREKDSIVAALLGRYVCGVRDDAEKRELMDLLRKSLRESGVSDKEIQRIGYAASCIQTPDPTKRRAVPVRETEIG